MVLDALGDFGPTGSVHDADGVRIERVDDAVAVGPVHAARVVDDPDAQLKRVGVGREGRREAWRGGSTIGRVRNKVNDGTSTKLSLIHI